MKQIKSIFEFFRNKREKLIANYLSKNLMQNGAYKYRYFWQPPLLVVFKLILLFYIFFKIFALYPVIGNSLETGLNFFKLSEIFKFKFPDKTFFYSVSKGLIIILMGIHGLPFVLNQLQALFSSIILNRNDKKLYYIKIGLVKREIFIFSLSEIEMVNLKQIFLLDRILNVGTIKFKTKNGDEIIVSSIGNAKTLVSQMLMG